ncbi:MAG: flagellar protein FliS [Anaeromicrobium sp.]|jgi:flagellin-specific chaperone FliS|uniref:flagellar export chaperone FliS n=1 Tax=Anaeromicrobium sp. TaxID=1929132 RepID=UPI0025DE8E76|nr:flagellar export chaperone FliS [Anaeromicrobium sp.]MCT4592705.1 flagellar protein FliS [Anaeromicrobium sp.]
MDNKYYINKISTSNEAGLVAVMYELLIRYMENCIVKIENEEIEYIHIKKCKNILNEFFLITEGDNKISNNIRGLLLYVNKLIDEGYNFKDIDKYRESIKIIRPLYEAWNELSMCESNDLNRYNGYGMDKVYTQNNFNGKG